jgi:hypothetical protein
MLSTIMNTLRHLLGKRKQIAAAVQELDDLPKAFEDLLAIFGTLGSLRDELHAAMADGKLTPREVARIEGRLGDLVSSGEGVVREITEAVEALQPLFQVPGISSRA